MKIMKNNIFPITVIVVGLIISGTIIYSSPKQQVISVKEAQEIAKDFINNKILQGQVDASFSNVYEESGVYKIPVSVQNSTFYSYISKDGKLFFTEALDIENFDASLSIPSTPAPSEGGMVGGC